MAKAADRGAARRKRHSRIRLHLAGTTERPRLAVFRSIEQIYAQVIDDTTGHTLASASSLEASRRSPMARANPASSFKEPRWHGSIRAS